MRKPDFSGWATRNGIKCSDGRVIGRNAFRDQDGETVSMVWQHRHDDPEFVIGHALLHNVEDGVVADCYINDSPKGMRVKDCVKNGDLFSLSIHANNLIEHGHEVVHGVIREVSVVLSGANKGATIIPTTISHSAETDEDYISEAVITTGEPLIIVSDDLMHSSDDNKQEETKVAETDKKEKDESQETVGDVFDTLTDKQKKVVYALIGEALDSTDNDEDDDDDEENEKSMKHNAFDQNTSTGGVLTHSDLNTILATAKDGNGSFKDAYKQFVADNEIDTDEIMHDGLTSSGFSQDTTRDGNITWLFPEYQLHGPKEPELITNDRSWIASVINGTTKLPYSRVRTRHVDIRNIDDLRARGYQKGEQKDFVGNYELVRRETDPQTVYVESELERDDIIDITDFDYVAWQYKIDRGQLEEELAMAIMLGDGRANGVKGKIYPTHIRPIWTDDELYTLHRDINVASAREKLQGDETGSYFGDEFVYSEALIETVLQAQIDIRGTGTPSMWISPWMLNTLMLARDRNGRRIRSTVNELAQEMNVGAVHKVQQFQNRIRTDSQGNKHKLLCIIGNMTDYGVGSTKGGQITHFTDFDIRFNQHISLLETRLSGANMAVYSFLVVEEPYTS